jgi:hypothetical protein
VGLATGNRSSGQTVLTNGLVAPGGLAVKDNAAYVSNCGVCPGTGTVLRVPLP